MKHFVIEITYTAAAEQVAEVRPEHRTFLQAGYDKGWLLFSGPQVGKAGGLIVARAPSREEIQALVAQDPYHIKSVATHSIIEFDPVMRQAFMESWVTE
jgi:uncharacterized protein YciI